jgi:type VI secretion system protein ImpI
MRLTLRLTLRIENPETLPKGTPSSLGLAPGGKVEIGRGSGQDWCLPDPSRVISSRHCEVRWHDDAFWLHDTSANGTFLDKSTSRLEAPHKLADGDRFSIGTYIFAVMIEPSAALAEPPVIDTSAPLLGATAAEASNSMPAGSQVLDAEAPHLPVREAAIEPSARPSVPADETVEPAVQGPSCEEFLRHLAAGAGVPEHIFMRRDSLELADELGMLLRITSESLMQLLRARSSIGQTAGVSAQTMVQALDNNPLKFTPGTDDAMRIMFGPSTRGFLDARRAIEAAFTDLKTHQVHTFAAMQKAIRMLVEDFDPASIEAAAGPDHGLANLLGSRKARLWDIYLARWQAQTRRHEDGLAGAFLRYFGQCFDEAKGAGMH